MIRKYPSEWKSAHDAWSRDHAEERTDEVWDEEEDILLVGLGGGEVDGDLCVDDVDRTSPADDSVGHGRTWDGGGEQGETRGRVRNLRRRC